MTRRQTYRTETQEALSVRGVVVLRWRVIFLIAFLCCFDPRLGEAAQKSLLLDFGPTVITSAVDRINSPAHSLGVIPSSETNWNQIYADQESGLVYGDGSSAAGVTVVLGRSDWGVGITVNFNNKNINVTGLVGAAGYSSGAYGGNSPMKDGIFAAAAAGNAIYNTNVLGVRIDGLAAGDYTVYFSARNSNLSGSQSEQVFCTNGPSALNYAFLNSPSAVQSNFYSGGPTTVFVEGDNFCRLELTLNPGDSIFIACLGTNVTERRGFLNLLQLVPGFHHPVDHGPPSVSPRVFIDQDRLTMTYNRPKTASNYVFAVAVSSNLFNWRSGPDHVEEILSADDGTNETHVARDKAVIQSKPAGFMRLQVVSGPRRIQGAKVVAFGDSITFGQGVPVAQSWVSLLTGRFNLNMINAGVSGNTSSQGLARIQNDVLNHNPDFVIINFGMNDHVLTDTDTPKVTTNVFRANLAAMIDRVRGSNAIPVLVTVNYIIEGDAAQYYYNRHPTAFYSNVGGAQAWLDRYIQIVRDLAAEKSVDLVDVRSACDAYDPFQFLRSLANGANADDGVHPYILGASVYAEVIGDYLAARY